jgi:hypothetical protein
VSRNPCNRRHECAADGDEQRHDASGDAAKIGSVTVQFASTTAGMLTFPNGRQVAIQRYQF